MKASVSASWADKAACLSEPADLFFPIGVSGPPQHVERAKAVCARCPVSEQCLSYALETGQQYGIWGGLTEDERRRARRAMRARAVRASR